MCTTRFRCVGEGRGEDEWEGGRVRMRGREDRSEVERKGGRGVRMKRRVGSGEVEREGEGWGEDESEGG